MTDRIQEFLRNRRSEGLDTEPCLVVDLEGRARQLPNLREGSP